MALVTVRLAHVSIQRCFRVPQVKLMQLLSACLQSLVLFVCLYDHNFGDLQSPMLLSSLVRGRETLKSILLLCAKAQREVRGLPVAGEELHGGSSCY